MKKYAVGLCDGESDIEVLLVNAEDEINAMINAIYQKYEWNICIMREYEKLNTTDDLINLAIQGDILISKPVVI